MLTFSSSRRHSVNVMYPAGRRALADDTAVMSARDDELRSVVCVSRRAFTHPWLRLPTVSPQKPTNTIFSRLFRSINNAMKTGDYLWRRRCYDVGTGVECGTFPPRTYPLPNNFRFHIGHPRLVKRKLSLTGDPNRSTDINLYTLTVRRSLHIVDWRTAVVEGQMSYIM